MAPDRLKLLPLFLAAPAAALACGGFFYPAPPTLDHYPERLPVKTMREILREANPPAADAATFDQLAEETRAIAANIGTVPRDQLFQRIDAVLARNRTGEYRKRFANCLYDLRDLLASNDAPPAEAKAYASWRADAMNSDDGLFQKPPAQIWTLTPEKLAEIRRAWQQQFDDTAARLAAEVEKASPALKPHWLVQAGAWQFKYTHFSAAAKLFQQVIASAPDHPRAEAAQLMLARAHIEEWHHLTAEAEKQGSPVPLEARQAFDAANQDLDAYLATYPKGRYAPDIPGWQAGLAREQGYMDEALRLFLQQTDFAEHPEIVRRAVREIEQCLDALDAAKIEEAVVEDRVSVQLPLEEIARRPLAALAVVYHFLDSESRSDFNRLLERSESISERDVTDRYLVPMLRIRRAGRDVLPALAAAVARQKTSYGGAQWHPKYLAILAWAASESGEHRQAISVCDLAGNALDDSDDLLFARAVALQRAKDFDGAIAGFRRLRDKHPKSPLTTETDFRIATALRDKGEAGPAVVELMGIADDREHERQERLQQPADEATDTVPDLHLDSEIDQWIETLLQFAPLKQLERALVTPNLEHGIAVRVRRMLRVRYLAAENFEAARHFIESQPAATEPSATRFEGNSDSEAELEGDALRSAIDTLATLRSDIDKASAPASRAEKQYALAEAWSKVRGLLMLRSTVDDERLQHNAQTYGIPAATAASELEARDELRHAYRYYLDAANSAPDSALAARALWHANDALRQMAELSAWNSARAFETNASELSRQLHTRLLRECPTSDEARPFSAWWSFPPSVEAKWLPFSYPFYQAELGIAKAFEESDPKSDDQDSWERNRASKIRFQAITANAATWDAQKLIDELQKLRRDFLPHFKSSSDASFINHIDDLTLFLHEPGLTPSARAKYFAARLADAPPDTSDPELQPWRDYLDFLALVRERPNFENLETGERRYRPMSERMREFLEKHPKSHKREAALARLAIATVRETHGHTGVVETLWPQSPRFGGYMTIAAPPHPPVDSARVFETIAQYEREFPEGQYIAEMRLWRGVAAIDARDWTTAFTLLVATLDEPTKRDLHLDAALNLADLFMRLLEKPELRPELIAAIHSCPTAQTRLHQFMYSDTPGARLRCLEGYLEEQFRPRVR